jgi:hypothetical protein
MNKMTLLALLPEWIIGGAVLLFIYKAPRLWLKIGEIVGWIFFLGAPVLAEIVTVIIDEIVWLRSVGLGWDETVTFFAMLFAFLGFSSIASSKLILWASGEDKRTPKGAMSGLMKKTTMGTMSCAHTTAKENPGMYSRCPDCGDPLANE